MCQEHASLRRDYLQSLYWAAREGAQILMPHGAAARALGVAENELPYRRMWAVWELIEAARGRDCELHDVVEHNDRTRAGLVPA